MYQNEHIRSHSFPQQMIVNGIVIILEGARANETIGYHDIILSLNLGCSINNNYKNSDIVSYCHGQFSGGSQGNKIWSIFWGLRCIILPGVSLGWCFIKKHEYSSIRLLSFKIMWMICISKSGDPNMLDLWIWNITWHLPHSIRV